jgi:hypothetical protein
MHQPNALARRYALPVLVAAVVGTIGCSAVGEDDAVGPSSPPPTVPAPPAERFSDVSRTLPGTADDPESARAEQFCERLEAFIAAETPDPTALDELELVAPEHLVDDVRQFVAATMETMAASRTADDPRTITEEEFRASVSTGANELMDALAAMRRGGVADERTATGRVLAHAAAVCVSGPLLEAG